MSGEDDRKPDSEEKEPGSPSGCGALIPGTFYMCGEGQYCSDGCWVNAGCPKAEEPS